MIQTFEDDWFEQQRTKPRILVLEVRHPEHLERSPVASIVVERSETIRRDERDNSVYKASVTFSYELITNRRFRRDREHGEFSASYSQLDGLTSLTSSSIIHGAVFFDPDWLRGHRVGTYLMNEIVTWAKRWPDATVKSIELSAGQANEENKVRRNWFYEQFGLNFDYADPEHRAGTSKPMLVRDLKQVDKWKENITEYRMFDYLLNTRSAREKATLELVIAKQENNELINAQLKAQQNPIQWALGQLF